MRLVLLRVSKIKPILSIRTNIMVREQLPPPGFKINHKLSYSNLWLLVLFFSHQSSIPWGWGRRRKREELSDKSWSTCNVIGHQSMSLLLFKYSSNMFPFHFYLYTLCHYPTLRHQLLSPGLLQIFNWAPNICTCLHPNLLPQYSQGNILKCKSNPVPSLLKTLEYLLIMLK